jgi:hypothetical protein
MPIRHQKMLREGRQKTRKGEPEPKERSGFTGFMRNRWDDCWRDADKWVTERRAAKEKARSGKPGEDVDILPGLDDKAPEVATKAAEDDEPEIPDATVESSEAPELETTTKKENGLHEDHPVNGPCAGCDAMLRDPTPEEAAAIYRAITHIHPDEGGWCETCRVNVPPADYQAITHTHPDEGGVNVPPVGRRLTLVPDLDDEHKPKIEGVLAAMTATHNGTSTSTGTGATGEVTTIGNTRVFLDELATYTDTSVVPQLEIAANALANSKVDAETRGLVTSAQDLYTQAAGMLREAKAVLNAKHAAMEDAVNSTPEAAETDYYRS